MLMGCVVLCPTHEGKSGSQSCKAAGGRQHGASCSLSVLLVCEMGRCSCLVVQQMVGQDGAFACWVNQGANQQWKRLIRSGGDECRISSRRAWGVFAARVF